MATTKDMSGVLFKNVDKPEGRNRPDYSGDLLIAGMRYRIGGWVKESMRGKFLSLSIKKDEPAAEAKPAAKAAAYEPAADDSIPF